MGNPIGNITGKAITSGLPDTLKQIAHDASADIELRLKKAAYDAVESFYNSYPPKYYDRTHNLHNSYRSRVTPWIRIGGSGAAQLMSTIKITFSPDYMDDYRNRNSHYVDGGDDYGHFTFEEVNKDIVFNRTLVEGYHGNDDWFNTRFWVKRDVYDAAHGSGSWKNNLRQPAKKMSLPPISRDGKNAKSFMDNEFNKIADELEKKLMTEYNTELDQMANQIVNTIFGSK